MPRTVLCLLSMFCLWDAPVTAWTMVPLALMLDTSPFHRISCGEDGGCSRCGVNISSCAASPLAPASVLKPLGHRYPCCQLQRWTQMISRAAVLIHVPQQCASAAPPGAFLRAPRKDSPGFCHSSSRGIASAASSVCTPWQLLRRRPSSCIRRPLRCPCL